MTSEGHPSDIDQLSLSQLEKIVERFKKAKETGSPEKSSTQKQVDFDDGSVINARQEAQEKQNKAK